MTPSELHFLLTTLISVDLRLELCNPPANIRPADYHAWQVRHAEVQADVEDALDIVRKALHTQ